MLVVLAGGELFTGNTLILAAVCDRKVKLSGCFGIGPSSMWEI